jgi:hypothetical protein
LTLVVYSFSKMNAGNLLKIDRFSVKPMITLVAKAWAPFYCAHSRGCEAMGSEEVTERK